MSEDNFECNLMIYIFMIVNIILSKQLGLNEIWIGILWIILGIYSIINIIILFMDD